MNKVFLKNLVIGPGRPKICVPVMGEDTAACLEQIEKIKKAKKADMIEFRADYVKGLVDEEGKIDEALLLEIVKAVYDAAEKLPVCFTYRTVEDGGLGEISAMGYEHMLEMVAASTYADVIDVELLRGAELFLKAVKSIHSYHLHVIGSSHEFKKTPDKEEIMARLRSMQNMGADILKIAVMPENKQDVFTLMDATITMNERYAQQPVVTIAMGKEGRFTRLAGEFIGSAITFGTLEEESAPGQIESGRLLSVLTEIHSALEGRREGI